MLYLKKKLWILKLAYVLEVPHTADISPVIAASKRAYFSTYMNRSARQGLWLWLVFDPRKIALIFSRLTDNFFRGICICYSIYPTIDLKPSALKSPFHVKVA